MPHSSVEAPSPTRKSDSTPGAPVEDEDPLGREVSLLSATMLNVGQMLGSGIFAVPGVILNGVGSIGLLFIAWILAPVFAGADLMIFSELAAMFPDRAGAEVVYLEKAYPKPRFLIPTAFAVCAVLLSFSATNAVVFAQYVLTAFDLPITSYSQTVLALGVSTVASIVVGVSTKWSLKAVNILSLFKIMSLCFIIVVGIVALAGGTSVEDPYANFHNMFKGSTTNPNSLATALVKTNMSFFGYQNAFNLVTEVRGRDPVRTVRKAGYLSLSLVTLLYFFTNIAYVAIIPADEIANSGQLVAALLFERIFGDRIAARMLPLMVAFSCLGNIIAVTISHARVLREIARQGLLPYPSFFASIEPFGTPLGPVFLKWAITVIVILLLPAKDAFNFLLDLASYPTLIFSGAMVAGLWILRKQRRKNNVPVTAHRAWDSAVILRLAWIVLLLVMPWIPPEDGHSDVSFWYATYCVCGLAILLVCGIYYYIWIVVLPTWGGYEVVEETQDLSGGARTTRLVRRYKRSSERAPLIES